MLRLSWCWLGEERTQKQMSSIADQREHGIVKQLTYTGMLAKQNGNTKVGRWRASERV